MYVMVLEHFRINEQRMVLRCVVFCKDSTVLNGSMRAIRLEV